MSKEKAVTINPFDVSRSMFIEVLEAALAKSEQQVNGKYGSVAMVARYLQVDERMIRRWRKGIGPSQSNIGELYVNLKSF